MTNQEEFEYLIKEVYNYKLDWTHFVIPMVNDGYKLDELIIKKEEYESYKSGMVSRMISNFLNNSPLIIEIYYRPYNIDSSLSKLRDVESSEIKVYRCKYSSTVIGVEDMLLRNTIKDIEESEKKQTMERIKFLSEKISREISKSRYGEPIKYNYFN